MPRATSSSLFVEKRPLVIEERALVTATFGKRTEDRLWVRISGASMAPNNHRAKATVPGARCELACRRECVGSLSRWRRQASLCRR